MKNFIIGLVAVLAISGCTKRSEEVTATANNGKDGQSIKGDKGDKGDPGLSVKGDKGDPGKNGTNGVGTKGDKGDPGKDGKNGKDAVCGPGAPGPKGDPGKDGKDGKDGATPVPGLYCEVYDSRSVDRSSGLITLLSNAVPKFALTISQFDIPDSPSANGFPKFTAAQQALVGLEDYALDCSGFIVIPVSGNYTFRMLSDDGSKLAINNNLLINMDQLQSPAAQTTAPTLLYKGRNKINVLYFQGPHTQIALTLQWSGPGSSGVSSLAIIPNTVLFH